MQWRDRWYLWVMAAAGLVGVGCSSLPPSADSTLDGATDDGGTNDRLADPDGSDGRDASSPTDASARDAALVDARKDVIEANDAASVDASSVDAADAGCTRRCTPGACGANSDGCGGTCFCGASQRCQSSQCVQLCDPIAQTGCSASEVCRRDDFGELHCDSKPTSPKPLGANCDPTGIYLRCAARLSCTESAAPAVGYQDPGICHRTCNSSADCTGGATCSANTSRNLVCTLPCNPVSGTGCELNAELVCSVGRTFDGSPTCEWYGSATHAVGSGAQCGAYNASTYHCGNGTVCIGRTSTTPGRCRPFCTMGQNCASGPCVAIPGVSGIYGYCPP